jgi:hypothetical protein
MILQGKEEIYVKKEMEMAFYPVTFCYWYIWSVLIFVMF